MLHLNHLETAASELVADDERARVLIFSVMCFCQKKSSLWFVLASSTYLSLFHICLLSRAADTYTEIFHSSD